MVAFRTLYSWFRSGIGIARFSRQFEFPSDAAASLLERDVTTSLRDSISSCCLSSRHCGQKKGAVDLLTTLKAATDRLF